MKFIVQPSPTAEADLERLFDYLLEEAETINGLYKTELIHRRGPWKTREAVEIDTFNTAAWFNDHRLMKGLGYMPPAESEANYYRQLTLRHASVR
jgi:putative transposase